MSPTSSDWLILLLKCFLEPVVFYQRNRDNTFALWKSCTFSLLFWVERRTRKVSQSQQTPKIVSVSVFFLQSCSTLAEWKLTGEPEVSQAQFAHSHTVLRRGLISQCKKTAACEEPVMFPVLSQHGNDLKKIFPWFSVWVEKLLEQNWLLHLAP